MEIVGWTGGILFALCAVPQAYKCWQQKHAHGISYLLLIMWFFGELLTLIYISGSQTMQLQEKLPLILNYGANIISLFVIIYYRLFPGVVNRDK